MSCNSYVGNFFCRISIMKYSNDQQDYGLQTSVCRIIVEKALSQTELSY